MKGVDQRKVVLYVPDDLSKSIKQLLQQNECNVLRDLPYCSQQTIEDTVAIQPDVIILSEYIKWDKTDLIETVRYIRTSCSTTQIIAHIRERRRGDIFLHNLVSLVVYDIILTSEFNIKDIWAMIEHPASYGDVVRYHFPRDEKEDGQLPIISEKQKSILTKWEEEIPEQVDEEEYKDDSSFFKGLKDLIENKGMIFDRLKRLFVIDKPPVKQIQNSTMAAPSIIDSEKRLPANEVISSAARNNIPSSTTKRGAATGRGIKKSTRLVLVIGTDRYVGTTTVTVNLARQGQTIYYPEGYNQGVNWPTTHITTESINMREWGKWINSDVRGEVLIDCGHYTKTLDPWISKADVIFLVAENRSRCIESASVINLTPRTRLIINKATPNGIKPLILSRALNIPYSAVIPYDTEYRNNFGLALTRTSWQTLRDIVEKISEQRKD